MKFWKRIDVIDDIAIVRIPFEYDNTIYNYAEEIGKRSKVVAVWGRLPETERTFRTHTYVHLWGEKKSEVIYREYGVRFYLDFTKVFFSAKLKYEHFRVCSQVRKGEVIANLFAGAGFFSIHCASKGASVVYSVDINPYAYYYTRANMELNRTWNVIPILGDTFKVYGEMGEVDRVISPLPELYREAYEVSTKLTKRGGIIHLFAETSKPEELAQEFKASFYRIVRSSGPRKYHVILDIPR
ncbi:methyltransferase [Sulfolobales archaeon HS-7]|nr:methyltransferase [Sulfolobales archaeon HS-7]